MTTIRKHGLIPRRLAERRSPYPSSLLDEDVLGALGQSDMPLSAYDLSDRLRHKDRSTAVMSIYRSLARLCARHEIEKIEMTSRYRLRDVERPLLMTCAECGRTDAMPAVREHQALEDAMARAGFAASKIALEASGICHECRPSTAES